MFECRLEPFVSIPIGFSNTLRQKRATLARFYVAVSIPIGFSNTLRHS